MAVFTTSTDPWTAPYWSEDGKFPQHGEPGELLVSCRSLVHFRRQGFTLIEVLIAMVILAVGLLGLSSLGVTAVRSVGLGERNTRASAVANEYLEDALEQLRRDDVPDQFCDTLPNGDIVSRQIAFSSSNHLARVTVTVTPEPRGSAPNPFSATSHTFSPNTFTGPISGSAC